VPAVSPLGKVAKKAPARPRRSSGPATPRGGAKPPAITGAGAAGPSGASGGGGVGAVGMTADQLLQPPVPPSASRPEDDPAFTRVAQGIAGFAKAKRAHPSGAKKAHEAQGAAVAPPEDLAGQAKAAKVDSMDAQQAGSFDKQAFIAAVKTAIEAKSPKTLEEADDYQESGKAGEVQGEVRGMVSTGKEGQAKDIETATAAPPDQSKAVAKQVTPMAAEQPGSISAIPAAGAAPKPAPAEQTNLQAGKHQADQEMAAGGVTESQLAASNEPQFVEALGDKKAAAAHADSAPAQFRQQEQAVIGQSKAAAATETTAAVTGMQGAKGAAIAKLVAEKGKAKSKDEAKRAEVTAKVQSIFAATEADVRKILDGIDPKVDAAFEQGEAAARAEFERFVAAKMAAYKADRYGGWLGGLRWAKDKLVGMPDKVNEFYVAGRELYLKRMDGVITRVADTVGNDLGAAKRRIAAGRAEIASYVKSLPEDLKKVGAEASEEVNEKFGDLERDVDAKQDAVVDSLATKFVEARKGLDERIEALQAENKGLVDKAIGAIKAVINTIRELVAMLTGVLARVAGVIGDIVKAPVEFLGNLIAGIKGGILLFKDTIVDHLRKGLMSWLFGALAEGGVELPGTFDLKGIIQLLLSLFGLTWANIRNRLVRQIGAKAMSALEKGASIFQTLATVGIGGLWEKLLEQVGDIKELILEKVKDFVVTRIITAGITWLIGLLNPAAAFIKACKLIYDVVMFFVSNAGRIAKFVNTVIDSVADVVKGNVGGVINKINDVLGQMVPIMIGFFASLIGLGGVGQKIREIVGALQKPINKALDFVIKTGLKLAGPLIRSVTGVSSKVKAKVAAGKAYVKGKVEAGKQWAKEKVNAIAGRFTSPFSVRLASGAVERHTVTNTVTADGRVSTVVASTPTDLTVLLGLARSRLAELPTRAPEGRQPRGEALTAINNLEGIQAKFDVARTDQQRANVLDSQTRNVQRLLEIQNLFGRPVTGRMAEEPQTNQKMTARITVMVPPGQTPLEMSGNRPRGATVTPANGGRYSVFDIDDRLPPDSRTPKGGVFTGTNAANTSGGPTQREVVTKGWAARSEAYHNSNTGHTEAQFDRFLDAQDDAFKSRIIAIEIHSTLSPCSACASMLVGISSQLRKLRGPRDPADPSAASLPAPALTFLYTEAYVPKEHYNSPNRQAGQTRASDLTDLRDAGWLLNGPRI
jgi:hypothetical protein